MAYSVVLTVLSVFVLCVNFCSAQAGGKSQSEPGTQSSRGENSRTFYQVPENISLRNTIFNATDYVCGPSAFCNKSLSNQTKKANCVDCSKCFCDTQCHFYGDCCSDLIFKSDNELLESPRYTSCQSESIAPRRGRSPNYSLMVTSCPINTPIDEGTRQKCENSSLYVIDEATFVSDANYTYKNMFCAICHGHNDFTRWRHHVECESAKFLSETNNREEMWALVLENPECRVETLAPPWVKRRPCVANLIDRCNITGRWDGAINTRAEEFCGLYNSPVGLRNEKYKNVFCALCNAVRISIHESCNAIGGLEPPGRRFPLSVLLDFNPKPTFYSSPVLNDETKATCNLSSLYDPSLETCRKARCSVGRVLSEGRCLPIFGSSKGLGYSAFVELTSQEDLPIDIWDHILQEYHQNLESALNTYSPFVFPKYSQGVYAKLELIVKSIEEPQPPQTPPDLGKRSGRPSLTKPKEVNTTLTGPSPPNTNDEQIPHLVPLPLPRPETPPPVSRTRDIVVPVISGVGAFVELTFISMHSGNQIILENDLRDSLATEVIFMHAGRNKSILTHPVQCEDKDMPGGSQIFNERHIAPDISPLCESGVCNFNNVQYYPILSILDCAFLEYNLSDAIMVFNSENSTIEMYNQTFQLESQDFWLCGDTLRICSGALSYIEDNLVRENTSVRDRKITKITIRTGSFAEFVVSTVCIALSLFCLLVTFIVYCLLPQLRTVPGKNTMVLVVYLFSAQLLFVVGIRLIETPDLCRAMGIAIHYLWVATFTAMGVCAFHMHVVFTRLSVTPLSSSSNDAKTLFRYIFLINLVPVVVVGTCIGYHAGLSDGSDLGYGGDICFLNQPLDIGVFFAAPLGIVLVLNIVFFVRVVMAIRRVPRLKLSKNKSDRNHLHIYFRLSVLLGFEWIFGFIAAATQLLALWYIFDVLNGLQGVFIFVAYCFNKRTLVMLKEVYCTRQSSYDESKSESKSNSTKETALNGNTSQ